MRTHKHSPRKDTLTATMPPPDLTDPVQVLAEEQQADSDADNDDVDQDDTSEARTANADDTGELYGSHLTPAEAPERAAGPEGAEYAESELGENWLETLEADAAEGGPIAEREIDATDDQDHDVHHGDESGDRPVADKGSGGPAGM